MISIIIPVYNREKYIEECIHSIQAQSYKNYEIILVDDGSTDDTPSICRALAQGDPAIRVLESSHVGVSEARNIGLEAVKGDFVFFLDSDDILHPCLLESLVTAMKETGAALAGTECVSVWEKYWHKVYEHIEKNPGPGETRHLTFEETMESVFTGKSPLGMIGGVMMRFDIIGDTRFRPDLYIGEDFFFIYENMIKGGSAIFLKQKWYFGRNHANNTSWDFGYTGFMNRFLRRELVWKSEEALGRTQYAAQQKNQVISIYGRFLERKSLCSDEKRKIKKIIRSYGKNFFRDLTLLNKVRYVLFFWIPGGGSAVQAFLPLIRRIIRILRTSK